MLNVESEPFRLPAREIEGIVRAAVGDMVTKSLVKLKRELKDESQPLWDELKRLEGILESKIDRDFVERLFDKFRLIEKSLKERVDELEATLLGWVTREELQEALEQVIARLTPESGDTAGGAKPQPTGELNCLLCGVARSHVAGSLVGRPPTSEHGRRKALAYPRPRTVVQMLAADGQP